MLFRLISTCSTHLNQKTNEASPIRWGFTFFKKSSIFHPNSHLSKQKFCPRGAKLGNAYETYFWKNRACGGHFWLGMTDGRFARLNSFWHYRKKTIYHYSLSSASFTSQLLCNLWTSTCFAAASCWLSLMKFVFLEDELCLVFHSDSTTQWIPSHLARGCRLHLIKVDFQLLVDPCTAKKRK